MTDPLDPDQEDYNDRQSGPLPEDRPTRAPTPEARKRSIRIAAVILSTIAVVLAGSCFIGASRTHEAAHRMRSSSYLKQIGLAIHNYNDICGEMPYNSYGPDGKPLLSWRVHILPYIEQDALFQQFNLDEPWDSPHNYPLLRRMPATYARSQDRDGDRGIRTYYRGFSSPGAIFEFRPSHVLRDPVPIVGRLKDPRTMLSLAGIKDGTSNTILIVEAGDSVEWTKPEDLDASPGKPFPRMGGFQWRSGVFQVLLCDGSVRGVKPSVSEATLRAAVTHNGGEILGPDWD